MMNPEIMKKRTKQFALRIIKLARALPKTIDGRTIGNQIIRCGTSVASNYRAACRARSRAEFIAKLGIVEEEADESVFWIEIIIVSEFMKKELVELLLKEANEITVMIVSSKKSARKNKNKSTIDNRKS